MLDLLDYCHRRLTGVLGGCEGVRRVEEVDSDSSGDEDGLPTKSKLVKVSLTLLCITSSLACGVPLHSDLAK